MAVTASRTLSEHEEYHAGLSHTLELRSDDFGNGGRIPVEFTCEGEGISPHLEWSGAPSSVRSYAVVETDWDVPSPGLRLFHVPHWVLYDISPEVTEIPSAASEEELRERGVSVGTAMGGTEGYVPSCPPFGDHAYEFHVYALDTAVLEPESPDREGVMAALEGHVLAYGSLTAYRSPGE